MHAGSLNMDAAMVPMALHDNAPNAHSLRLSVALAQQIWRKCVATTLVFCQKTSQQILVDVVRRRV